MSQYCREIRDDFRLYTKILSGLKIVASQFIELTEGKGAHRKYLLGEDKLSLALKNEGKIKIRQSKSLLWDYGFQVFMKSIKKPILRFDAGGVTHYNNDDTIPLPKREIKTPHFHKYNEKGVEIAYRTPIIDEKEKEIQDDIKVGFHYFCEENFIQTHDGLEQVLGSVHEFFPEEISNDVHKGIDFP